MAQEQNRYLLLDSGGVPLAQAKIQGEPSGTLWQLRILGEKEDEVLEHKNFKLMSITDSSPSYEGTLVRSRNDMIQLEVTKINADAHDMRKNLRVVVHFDSFIYPLSGGWTGRRKVESNDLSAGGIAIFTDHSLQVGEQLEVVIPVTAQPLVLRGQVLGIRPSERTSCVLYAAKFLELCNDEETMLREAVFNLQLRGRPKPAGPGA